MYQSLRDDSRLQKFNPSRFQAVIVDEAHHAAAKT
jgi:superfamily II DNA or RNA helicase